PEQDGPRYWQMQQPDGERNEVIENRCLELHPEEIRVAGKQSRVEMMLNSCEVKGVILQTGVIAHHENGSHCETCNNEQVAGRKIATPRSFAGLTLCRLRHQDWAMLYRSRGLAV